jgi:hypothetical protein
MYHLKGNSNTIAYYGKRIKSGAGPPPCNRLSQPPRDTRVKATLVARPLLTPSAQKLCRCLHYVFTSRTCVHSRTLLRIQIVLLLFVKHLAMRILTSKYRQVKYFPTFQRSLLPPLSGWGSKLYRQGEEVVNSSKTSVETCQTTRCNIKKQAMFIVVAVRTRNLAKRN